MRCGTLDGAGNKTPRVGFDPVFPALGSPNQDPPMFSGRKVNFALQRKVYLVHMPDTQNRLLIIHVPPN